MPPHGQLVKSVLTDFIGKPVTVIHSFKDRFTFHLTEGHNNWLKEKEMGLPESKFDDCRFNGMAAVLTLHDYCSNSTASELLKLAYRAGVHKLCCSKLLSSSHDGR